MHKATLTSPRLQRVLELLKDRGPRGATTREIVNHADVCAVNSIIAELRANCIAIETIDEGINERGSHVYRYRLIPPAPAKSDLFEGVA